MQRRRRKRAAWAGWLTAAVTACAGPPPAPPEAALERAWDVAVARHPGARAAAAATEEERPGGEAAGEIPSALDARDPDAWSLDRVLQRIAEANPTVEQAHQRVAAAQAQREAADAMRYPELSLGVHAVYTDDPARAFGLLLNQRRLSLGPSFDATPDALDNWRKQARVDWALFAPGRGEARALARAEEEAAVRERRALEHRLLNAGVQAWLELRAARALAAVTEESVTVVARRLEQTRLRHEEGAAVRADVLRLEVRRAEARRAAARAGLDVRRAASALNELMGRPPEAPLPIVGRAGDEQDAVIGADLPEELPGLYALAERERSDLQAAAWRVRALQAQVAAARADRRPMVGAFAEYGIDGSDPGVDLDLDSYTLGLGVDLPLRAGTGARIRRAQAEERAARAALQARAHAVAREVRDAHAALDVARETRALSEASVSAAEEAFRIVAASQDAGAATVTDVLEAEDALRRARVAVAVARAGEGLARARLVAATGGVR